MFIKQGEKILELSAYIANKSKNNQMNINKSFSKVTIFLSLKRNTIIKKGNFKKCDDFKLKN